MEYSNFGYVAAKFFIVSVEYNRKCRALKKLPQLPSHWLLGHLREVQAESTRSYLDCSQRVMEEKRAKCFVLWIGPFPFIQICHPDTFKRVTQKVPDKDTSWTGPYHLLREFIGEGLLGSNGLKWERNRKLLTPAFHFHILSGYHTVMNDVVETLLDQLDTASASGQSVDIFHYICRSTLDVVLRCSLSYEGNFQLDKNSHYLNAVQRILEIEFSRYIKPWQLLHFLSYMSPEGREVRKLCKITRSFTEDIINARRKELVNELLSFLRF